MRYRVFLSVLLINMAAILDAATLPSVPPPVVPGADTLLRAETLVYSETATTGEVERAIREARAAFQTIPDPRLRAYWEARAVLLLGSHLNHVENTRRASQVLPEGLELIETALAGGDFSDGLRVLADLHSQMTLARGMIHMIRHGETARDAAARARELDPDNIRALITVAGFYLNAPRIAGGDTRTGIERLELALQMNPQDRNDRFMIIGWLAEAHLSLGNREAARYYALQAREIYRESRWIRKVLREIDR